MGPKQKDLERLLSAASVVRDMIRFCDRLRPELMPTVPGSTAHPVGRGTWTQWVEPIAGRGFRRVQAG